MSFARIAFKSAKSAPRNLQSAIDTAQFFLILAGMCSGAPTYRGVGRSGGSTPGIGDHLGWAGDEDSFDPATARPTINTEAQRGKVQIAEEEVNQTSEIREIVHAR